jgi:hypothetical protein
MYRQLGLEVTSNICEFFQKASFFHELWSEKIHNGKQPLQKSFDG